MDKIKLLLKAIECGNKKEICKLILDKTIVSELMGTIALRKAVSCNNLNIAQLLVESGIDVNALPENTPLYQAILSNNIEMVRLLISAGANVNKREEEGRTALMFAVYMNSFEIVKELVEAGADVNMESYQGDIAICDAAANGSKKIFDYLFPLSESKWQNAAKEELLEGVNRRQIQEEADPLVNALVSAVVVENIEEVQQIIAAGTDVNGFDDIGTRALWLAVRKQSVELVQLLLKAGANPNISHLETGETPLMIVHNHSWRETAIQICSLLLDAGADVNARDTEIGKTVLMHNVGIPSYADEPFKANCRKIVQALLQYSADVNVKDREGNTALGIAREAGHDEIVQLLLDAGATEE